MFDSKVQVTGLLRQAFQSIDEVVAKIKGVGVMKPV